MSRLLWTAIAVGAVVVSGCGSSPNTARALVEERKGALEELGLMLKTLAEEGRKPPERLAALGPVEPMIPVAGPAIRNGTLIYFWGTPYAAGGKQVVAYEKQATTDGGFVLFEDGTVKEMTTAEFQAAPKAKK
jgi:hypothetical protein